MKMLRLSLLGAVALLLLGQSPAIDEQAVRVQVRRLLDDQVEAWNRKDIESFMEGYARSEDLTFIGGGQRLRGYEALLERYRATYAPDEMDRLAFRELEIEPLCEHVALASGRYHLAGPDRIREGIFSLVLRRGSEGFRIVYDHTSATN